MSTHAPETAYYIDAKLCRVAFVAKGIRFPGGRWIRLVGASVLPWYVEQLVKDLFPAVDGEAIHIAMLLTDFDVDEFERHLEGAPGHP